MAASQNSQLAIVSSPGPPQAADQNLEPPMTVKDAAKFLGVSPQTGIFGLNESRFPISA